MLLFKKRKDAVEGGDILVGEREEDKKNFSMLTSVAGKISASVNSLRITASTNNKSANANIASDSDAPPPTTSGPDHSHVTNTIIAPPASKKEPAIYKVFQNVRKSLPWTKKTMSRGPSGGRLR